MTKLPPRVHEKHGAYYLVTGNKLDKKWVRLSRVKQGLAPMYQALARLAEADVVDDTMPRLVAQWMLEVSVTRTPKTQANDAYMSREVSKGFAEFKAGQVRPPHVMEFLKAFKAMPRTYNAYRAHIRELMRFAEEKGLRETGTNPCDSLKTMRLVPRTRYVTDSELRRIKVAACYGADGQRTRSGLMICALVDLAYLTGQRIGDLLTLRWSQVTRDGILFAPAKVSGSTGAKVLIEMTPKLQDLIARLRILKRAHITQFVITTQHGQPMTYSGAESAWKRAVKRAGVQAVHFHDIKAKALTDVDEKRGIGQAQTMGGHSTQNQTADYIRHKKAKKTGATR